MINVLKAKAYNTNAGSTLQMGFITANRIKEGRNARKLSFSDMHKYEHVLRSISST